MNEDEVGKNICSASVEMKKKKSKSTYILKNILFNNFSEEQQRIIEIPMNVNLCIIACPGSGKTSTLTARIIKSIIEEKQSIVCITFTNYAASDLKDKIMKKINCLIDICVDNKINQKLFNNKNNVDLIETYRLMKDNADIRNKILEEWNYVFCDEFQDTNTTQFNILQFFVNHNVPSTLDQSIYTSGNLKLEQTFFNNNCNEKNKTKKKCNLKDRSLTVIGDDDQSIYSFRGAHINVFYKFLKDCNCLLFKLNNNFRSTREIVRVSQNLIINNRTCRIQKQLYTAAADCLFCFLNDFKNNVHEKMLVEKVTLTTIHKAKGLEWKVVFIINVTEGEIPQAVDSKQDIIEERKIFYVGITRAKFLLYLLCSIQNNNSEKNTVSRFINEMNI
nr:UvrD [synthetic construct]